MEFYQLEGMDAARRESEEQEMKYLQKLQAAERSRDEAHEVPLEHAYLGESPRKWKEMKYVSVEKQFFQTRTCFFVLSLMWQDNSALILYFSFLKPMSKFRTRRFEEFAQALEAVEAMRRRSAVLHEEEIATMAKMEEHLRHQ